MAHRFCGAYQVFQCVMCLLSVKLDFLVFSMSI